MDIRTKIIDGAGELFTRYGVRSVSMDDIARQLSISKKTIYQYFKDKDEIVTKAVRARIEFEKEEYDEIFDSSHDAVEELAKVSKCMRKDFHEMNPSLLFDLQKYHPKAWAVWLDFKNKHMRDSIVTNLKRGIAEGYFREEIDPEFMAILRVEQVQLVFDNQIFPSDQFNLKETQMKLLDHYVHGIVTEKGRKLYMEYLEKEKTLNQTSNN
ncbi:TetR/AcrR family transcriptional regulator [Fulvivirga kasyanovii]